MSTPEITPESLMDDNRSEEAGKRLGDWEKAKDSRFLYAVWGCSDSRLVLPFRQSVHIRSITAGGPRSPFSAIISDPRVRANVVVCHHDGDEAIPGRSPGGCGGRQAKEELEPGTSVESNGVGEFIKSHVWDSDLIGQSYTAAAFTAYRSGRPTLAATQDHLDLTIYPLAVFQDFGREVEAEVPLHLLLAGKYFPNMIYQNGLPVLGREKIPTIFGGFLQENVEQSSRITGKHRDLRETQKSQKPRLLVVSTDIRPFAVRYPNTTSVPGTIFRISVPQQTIDGATRIEEAHLVTALQQAHYPVEHFSNLGTILIETRSLAKSAGVAQALKDQDWMKHWILDPTHHILIAQVRRGETQFIESI